MHAQIGSMLLSAAIFGFFGFYYVSWAHEWTVDVVGLAVAAALIGVAVWDMNSTYYAGAPIVLLVILAAWNGYHSWAGLRECMAMRGSERA